MRNDHDYSLVGFCSPEAKKVLLSIRIHFPTFKFCEEIYKLEWFFLWRLLLFLATYNWPLNRKNHLDLPEILTSRTSAFIQGPTTFFDTRLNVISRGAHSYVSLGSFQGECLGKMDFCANGLSIGFWMSYRGTLDTAILSILFRSKRSS